jgi:hypothetical protein
MGYFSNGTQGDCYEERYCSRCIHVNGKDGKSGCAVMLAHMLHNYKECNNKDSILHLLIRQGNGNKGEPWNYECEMFHDGKKPEDPNQTQMNLT